MTGKIIWLMSDGVNQKWNVFAPGYIQDITGDGVRDMVVVNGGDTSYKPEVCLYIFIRFLEAKAEPCFSEALDHLYHTSNKLSLNKVYFAI